MTTKEVSKKSGYSVAWCCRWAKYNNVAHSETKIHGISPYEWNESDLKSFIQCPKIPKNVEFI